MLVLGFVMHFLFPIEGQDITYKNGVEQVSGPSHLQHTDCIFNLINIVILCSPANREELFNLRHASARNVVERIFGILKKRFSILTRPSHFDMDIQARIPPALAAVHNFILENDWADIQRFGDVTDENPGPIPAGELRFGTLSQGPADQAEKEHAAEFRDQIVQEMWESYQQVLLERGEDLLE